MSDYYEFNSDLYDFLHQFQTKNIKPEFNIEIYGISKIIINISNVNELEYNFICDNLKNYESDLLSLIRKQLYILNKVTIIYLYKNYISHHKINMISKNYFI